MRDLSQRGIYKNRGAALLFAVTLITVITATFANNYIMPSVRELRSASRDIVSNDTYLLAEAGNEDIFYRVRKEMNVPNEVVISLNDKIATSTVTDVSATQKQVVTEGETSEHKRKTSMTFTTLISDANFLYGAQIGDGGLVMDNNSSVEGTLPAVGDIYSNGPILGSPGAKATGDVYVSNGISLDLGASQTTCDSDQIFGKTNPDIDIAQSFVPSVTDTIQRVEFYIKKNGNPSSVDVYIVNDVIGSPGTTALTSGELDRSDVGSSYAWVGVPFDTAVTLNAGQTYWVVIDANRHNSKYWQVCKSTADLYALGVPKISQDWTSDPWNALSGDLNFKMYFGVGDSQIKDVWVQGDAHADTLDNVVIDNDAYYQTKTGGSVGGTEYPGSPTPSEVPLPIDESLLDTWVSVAEDGGTIVGDCPGTAGCGAIMGPVKVDGNFSVVDGGTLTISGTLYVTGNLTTDNNITVRCSAVYAENTCIIIVDGYIDVRNNSKFLGSGDPKSFILVISRKAGCYIDEVVAGCGPSNSGIHHTNNAVNEGIFYVKDSFAVLENNTNISSVLAYGLKLEENGSVVYNADIEQISISAGGTGGWLVNEWREVE
jgi:hypothetical protein